MRAVANGDQTKRVITLDVSDVPDLDVTDKWHTKPRVIRPDTAKIVLIDGAFDVVNVSGDLVLESGETTVLTRDDRAWRSGEHWQADQRIENAPEWVQALVNEAPQGVTQWVQPDNDSAA